MNPAQKAFFRSFPFREMIRGINAIQANQGKYAVSQGKCVASEGEDAPGKERVRRRPLNMAG